MSERSRVIEGITGLLVEFLRVEGIEPEESERRLREVLHEAGAAALGRRWTEDAAEGDAETTVCTCGRTLARRGREKKRLLTLLGWTGVERAYYWCPECGCGRHLLDERLGCRGRAQTGVVQECVGMTVAEETYAGGRRLLATLTGLEIPHHTLETIAEDIGESLVVERDEGSQAEEEETPGTLCISTDGVKVPMRDGWHEARVVASFAYDVSPGGSEPERSRVAYSARVEDSEATGRRMAAEARRRGAERASRLVVIGDGADWIWNQAQEHFPQAIEIVDWYHAVEHLWDVANTLFGQGSNTARAWAKARKEELWQGDVDAVLQAMRTLFWQKRGSDGSFRNSESEHVLQTNMSYFSTHRKRMNYARFRREQLPMGSGVIESACKHFVAQRCKRSGMKWKTPGLHAVLELRAALLSNQWSRVKNMLKAA